MRGDLPLISSSRASFARRSAFDLVIASFLCAAICFEFVIASFCCACAREAGYGDLPFFPFQKK
jgi:hypothetical protein